MRQIFLIMIGLSSLILAEFSRSNVGVITDSVTTLQWQDDYGDNGIAQTTWTNAIEYCEGLELDGGGWRLPNLNELTSLVDDTRVNPAISSKFVNTSHYAYWSSTKYVQTIGASWIIFFYNGQQGGSNNRTSNFVRCVRAGE